MQAHIVELEAARVETATLAGARELFLSHLRRMTPDPLGWQQLMSR